MIATVLMDECDHTHSYDFVYNNTILQLQELRLETVANGRQSD